MLVKQLKNTGTAPILVYNLTEMPTWNADLTKDKGNRNIIRRQTKSYISKIRNLETYNGCQH